MFHNINCNYKRIKCTFLWFLFLLLLLGIIAWARVQVYRISTKLWFEQMFCLYLLHVRKHIPDTLWSSRLVSTHWFVHSYKLLLVKLATLEISILVMTWGSRELPKVWHAISLSPVNYRTTSQSWASVCLCMWTWGIVQRALALFGWSLLWLRCLVGRDVMETSSVPWIKIKNAQRMHFCLTANTGTLIHKASHKISSIDKLMIAGNKWSVDVFV